jgi:hypothetical protein
MLVLIVENLSWRVVALGQSKLRRLCFVFFRRHASLGWIEIACAERAF